MGLSRFLPLATLALALSLPLGAADAQAAPVKRVAGEASKRLPVVAPAAWHATAYPGSSVAKLHFRDLSLRRIQDVQNKNARRSLKPTQIGIARSTSTEGVQKVLPALRWVLLKSGGSVARIEVRSPDAVGLRVGLQLKALDPRMELRFAGSDDPTRVVAVVKARQANRLTDAQRLYWTPATDGEAQIIELYAPAGVSIQSAVLQVPDLSHLLTNSKNDFQLIKSVGSSGRCNVDTACRVGALGQGFVNAKNSVARMVFVKAGESYTCTGTLLNDTDAASQIPYFYSAHHCISDAPVANTLNTYWGFEATSCGSGVAAANTLLAGGAAYLYSDANTHALLLRLNNPAPAGAMFSGWDSSVMSPSASILGIHHPQGDLKKASLGQQIANEGRSIVVGWTSGTTEDGSDGSGLFTNTGSNYYLRGGLYGGSASCANLGSLATAQNRDWYSRFDVVYPNIRQYLAPATGNSPPTANFSATTTGLTASFSDSSSDSDGTIVSRSWTFGDGTTSTAVNPSRTYATAGTYSIQLTVTDNAGAIHSLSRSVAIGGTAVLLNGVAATGLAGATGVERRYTMTVPAGATRLRFTTEGTGTGNADLYVRYGAEPTLTAYDCSSTSENSYEFCIIDREQAGTYHVMVYSRSAFSDVAVTGSFIRPGLSTSLPRHDIDEDGKSDIFWRHTGNGLNTVWYSADSEARGPSVGVSNLNWKVVGIGDFDGDGNSDVFWRNAANGVNAIWKWAHPYTQQPVAGVSNQSWKVVGIGDFDGDGKSDVFWRNASSGVNAIWRSGNYATQQPVVGVSNPAWTVVGIGDFDGDRKSDVLWRNSSTGANTIWKSANAATQQAMATVPSQAWRVVGIGDFDGDGRSDVFWRNSSTGANTIWKSGNAATRQAVTTLSDQAWKLEATGDYDGDFKSDALWRNDRTGFNELWRSANSATPQGIMDVTNPAWIIVP